MVHGHSSALGKVSEYRSFLWDQADRLGILATVHCMPDVVMHGHPFQAFSCKRPTNIWWVGVARLFHIHA